MAENKEMRINSKQRNRVWIFHLINRLKDEEVVEVKALGSAIQNAIASVKTVEYKGFAEIIRIDTGTMASAINRLPSICITLRRTPQFQEIYEKSTHPEVLV